MRRDRGAADGETIEGTYIQPMLIDALIAGVRQCRACAADFAHEPRPILEASGRTKILICGQAPGRRAHESGRPFDDRSGDRLRDWLGVDRPTFYEDGRIGVAPMAFCYPGSSAHGDLPPPARCASLWRPALLKALGPVELTLLVGGYAHRWALGPQTGGVARTMEQWRRFLPAYLVLPHPSWRNTGWLARNLWFETDVAAYLRARTQAILWR